MSKRASSRSNTLTHSGTSPKLRRQRTDPLSFFYQDEGERIIPSRRLQITIFGKTFSLQNFDCATDPHQLFPEIVQIIFKKAIKAAEAHFGPTRALGCYISSPLLLQKKAIQIPLRPIAQNPPQVIVNRFEAVQQSHRPIDLLDGPVSLEFILQPENPIFDETGSGGKRIQIFNNMNMGTLIEVINENDNLCLFYAIELTRWHVQKGKSSAEKKEFERVVKGTSRVYQNRRRNLVHELLNNVNTFLAAQGETPIQLDLPQYSVKKHVPLIQRYLDHAFPNVFRIVIFAQSASLRPIWKGPSVAEYTLPIMYSDNHFYGIRNLNSFIGRSRYYCVDCEKTYKSQMKHASVCRAMCRNCCGKGVGFPCAPVGNALFCSDCKKYFANTACYSKHKKDNICGHYLACMDCGRYYKKSNGHTCGAVFCRACHQNHEPNEDYCYVKAIELKPQEEKKPYVLVFYDLESRTNDPRFAALIREDAPTAEEEYDYEEDGSLFGDYNMEGLHTANFVAAYLTCTKCIDNGSWRQPNTGGCKICGVDKNREVYWSEAENCPHPIRNFTHWMLSSFDWTQKVIAVAHYGGRYDMHFVLGEVYKMKGVAPKVVKDANKLYQLTIPSKKHVNPLLIFRDSYNWLQQPLAKLPAMLGLDIEDKGFFPYLFNNTANLHLRLSTLPDKEYYCPRSMKPERAKAFEQFYAENQHKPFCLKEALVEYCTQDVRILTHAMIKFRQMFLEITGDDMVENSATAASACMRYYCSSFLVPGQRNIGIIPENGYAKMCRQSLKALKFLKWYAHKHQLPVQHRDSVQGEKRYRNYHLDGYVQRSGGQRDLCIEFNGCAWHGHDCIFNDEDVCPNGMTAELCRRKLAQRRAAIEEEMDYLGFWECEVDEELQKSQEMRDFYATVRDTGPLNPKDAYFGARTGPTSLKCDLEEEDGALDHSAIGVFDIVSLYPFINYDLEYPLGHPQLIDVNKGVRWTLPSHNPYRGIIKCFVVPPRGLLHPIIPNKYGGRLMFVLCDACARANEKRMKHDEVATVGDIPIMDLCPHTDEERGFVATTTHLELNLALEKGYVVTHIFSAYHWEKWSTELFRPYVQKFMKMKVEASGWPSSVGDDAVRRAEYVDGWRDRFGIEIDPAAVRKNPVLKETAKIFLVVLWGKWSMRNNLFTTVVIENGEELHEIFNDRRLENICPNYVAEDLVMVTYRPKADFVTSHPRYNIVISLFTTAAGRVKLYNYMDTISSTPECKLLYTDTDSVFFRYPKGQCPITCGEFLGEMSDQYPDHHITSYYSSGCKAYALKMQHKDTSELDHVVKAKGITLDLDTIKLVNYNTFKHMVNDYGNDISVVVKSSAFQPNALRGEVRTVDRQKKLRVVFNKAMVDNNLDCYAFGYGRQALMVR